MKHAAGLGQERLGAEDGLRGLRDAGVAARGARHGLVERQSLDHREGVGRRLRLRGGRRCEPEQRRARGRTGGAAYSWAATVVAGAGSSAPPRTVPGASERITT